MATPQQSPGIRLQVRRTFAAPRERVFAAWTEPQQLGQWLGKSSPASKAEYLELEVRTDGRYRMKNTSPNGDIYMLQGIYREVRPPEKLVFTWQWTKTPRSEGKTPELEELGETLVTVEFFARGNSTEVVLTHEGFPTPEIRDRHTSGWNGCFNTLEGVLQVSGAN